MRRFFGLASRVATFAVAVGLAVVSAPPLSNAFAETVEYLVPRPDLVENVPSRPLLDDVLYVQVLPASPAQEQGRLQSWGNALRRQTLCVEALFGTYGRSNGGSLRFALADIFGNTTSELLVTVDLADNEYQEVCFEGGRRPAVDLRQGGSLAISASPSSEGGVSVWTTEDVRYGSIDGSGERSLALGVYQRARTWSPISLAAYVSIVLLLFALIDAAANRWSCERNRCRDFVSKDVPSAAVISRGLTRNGLLILVFAVSFGGVAALSAAGLSGSSVGTYGEAVNQERGLLLGKPKSVRSDEWMLHTPEKVRGAELLGLEHQSRETLDEQRHPPRAASRSLWQLFQPHLWAYHVIDVERAFAFEWWSKFGIAFSGIVALLAMAGVRHSIAVLAAAAVALSPVLHWWTLSMGPLFVGYGAFASACLLGLFLTSRFRGRLLYSSGATYFGIAFAVTEVYPPWQIPLVWVFAAVVTSVTFKHQGDSKGNQAFSITPWARRAGVSALWVVPGIVSAGAAFVLTAPSGYFGERLATEYPGNRRGINGGGASVRSATSALIEPLHSSLGYATINGLNQSENAAGFPLVVLVLALLVWRLFASPPGMGAFREVIPLLGAAAMLSAWVHLRVPSAVGRFVGLDRVQPERALMPLAVLIVLYLALTMGRSGQRPPRTVAAVALVGTTIFAALRLGAVEIVPEPASRTPSFVLLVGTVVVALLVLRGRVSQGFALLVALSLIVWAPINPVQRGLSVLLDSPLRELAHQIEKDEEMQRSSTDAARWLVIGELNPAVIHARSVLVASGVDMFPVTQARPSRAIWGALDAEGENTRVWNRQARIVLIAEHGPRFTREVRQPNLFSWGIDPCSAEVRSLSITHIVSQDDLLQLGFTCLRPVEMLKISDSLPALRVFELR